MSLASARSGLTGAGRASATFDGRGRVLSRTSAWGDVRSFEYDARDNITKLTRSPRAGCGTDTLYWCQTSVVTATYHSTWNKPLTVTLPATTLDAQAAGTWQFAYNSRGLLETITSPAVLNAKNGQIEPAVSHTSYDSFGRVTAQVDPTGIRTSMEYGGQGQPEWCLSRSIASSQFGGLNLASTFTCNTRGDVISATDPRGNTTTTTWDVLRRKTGEYGPTATQIKTTWTYDADGNVLTENRWDSTAQLWRTTATSWSLTGKPLTITNPAGDLARTCYNALDQVTIKVDPTGRATRNSYNAASQPTLIERWLTGDPSDATCSVTNTRPTEIATNRWRGFEYNVGGLQSAEIDGNGNRTTVTYDGLGRHMLTTYADGKFVQTLRNERDQVYTTFKRAGDMHQAYYDALGRVQRVWEHASAAANLPYPRGRHTRTSYDLAGRMMWNDVSMQTGGVYDATLERDIRTYQYDAAGRVVEDRIKASASATQQVLTYGYDAAGNRTSITWPDSYEAVYRFDAGNRADQVTFGPHTANITVDSLSRRTSLGRSNGTTTSYAYDDNGGLSQLAHAWASGSGQAAGTFSYGRDAAGRVINTTISRPDLEWMPTLDYARDYGVPTNLNQTTSMAGVDLEWDQNGNLKEHGDRRFVWTWGNRLAEVRSTGRVSVYAYDGQDRRTTVIYNGDLKRTLWSGADEVAEYNAGGQLDRRFIPDGTGAMDARLATVTPDGTAYWHHTDQQGSVIGTSAANGAPQDLTNYSPHGEFGNKPNGDPITLPPTESPFGYTGRQYDAATGLYQYRARYYDPELGIFLSMDPIGTKDDPNLYMYVGLDPVNRTDPTGEEAWLIARPIYLEIPLVGRVHVADHMFVVVADTLGGTPRAWYSYGPSSSSRGNPGYLVSLTNTATETFEDDQRAWRSLASNSRDENVRYRQIPRSDDDVIASGERADRELGTISNPGGVRYNILPTQPDEANSNSAATDVANTREPGDAYVVQPRGSNTPGAHKPWRVPARSETVGHRCEEGGNVC